MDKLLSMMRTRLTKDWVGEEKTVYKRIPLPYTTRNAAMDNPPFLFSWNKDIPCRNETLPQWNRPTYGFPMAKKYKCPFPDCTYETEEVTDVLAAVLLSVHSTGTHTATGVAVAVPSAAANTKLKKVRRPTISAAG